MNYIQRLEEISVKLTHRWDRFLSSNALEPYMTDTLSDATENLLSTNGPEIKGCRPGHALFHLQMMFEEFDKIQHKLQHPKLVEFAIFLHNIVNVVGRKDNKLKSAHVAKYVLMMMGTSAFSIRRVVRLISVGTKHTRSPKARLTNDEKYISDLDLYGFSLSYDAVLGQSRDVRREFSKFSDKVFRKSHGDFLASMLARRIYLTDYFSQYEQAARENIQHVLQNMDQVVMARPTDKRL